MTRAVYDVELSFTSPRLFRVPAIVRAHDADLWAYGVQVLLGRDVLRYCRFGYDGPEGRFTLDY